MMKFTLLKFLKDDKNNGMRRLKVVQPFIYEWIKEHEIPLLQKEGDVEFIQCRKESGYWYRTTDYIQKEFCFVDFYVEIPDDLLDDWNEVHVSKYIPRRIALCTWDDIHTVVAGKNKRGLLLWARQNINDEYFISGKTWGFKSKSDAFYFGMIWK